jgi:hypothetical protein
MTKEALQTALEALTDFDYDKRMKAIETIKEALETKDEPVGWIDKKGYMICVKTDESCRPLYTTPQRTWVWLTDKEVDECLRGLPTQTIDVYARRIETKIKEKNT